MTGFGDIFPGADAEAEQTAAAVRDMASMTGEFYRGLIADGFTNTEAMLLTGRWMTSMMVAAQETREEE